MNIIELIFEIEKRPALYISKNYLSCLKAFLDGWLMNEANSEKNSSVLSELQIWIQKKYNIHTSQSWADIIIFYSTDESEALHNFFALFHEFLSTIGNGGTKF